MKNYTVTAFILLGLTDGPDLQVLIFVFLFHTYTLSVTGNLTILTQLCGSSPLWIPHLKTAMYFFLQNFSFLEISFTTACIPRYLYDIARGDKVIAYKACVIQLFFIDGFAVTEFFLLATMCFDQYVAICKPLHYMTIMNYRACLLM
ncbi:Olfactory receptor 6C68, partial [Manis javanica]